MNKSDIGWSGSVFSPKEIEGMEVFRRKYIEAIFGLKMNSEDQREIAITYNKEFFQEEVGNGTSNNK
ncbi:MAG TPA: hypothetical protein VMW20_07715 [Candidatus Nanoarchaeia archaeon]|nr:hypothetical protein [Candidatus Nanoarchaeia archaeon]